MLAGSGNIWRVFPHTQAVPIEHQTRFRRAIQLTQWSKPTSHPRKLAPRSQSDRYTPGCEISGLAGFVILTRSADRARCYEQPYVSAEHNCYWLDSSQRSRRRRATSSSFNT